MIQSEGFLMIIWKVKGFICHLRVPNFLKKIMQNENRLYQLNHIAVTKQWLSSVTGKFHCLEENLSHAQTGLENREGTINKKAGLNNKKN